MIFFCCALCAEPEPSAGDAMCGLPHAKAERKSELQHWIPTRHGIPHGMVSHTAWYPTRHGISHCTVSRTALLLMHMELYATRACRMVSALTSGGGSRLRSTAAQRLGGPLD